MSFRTSGETYRLPFSSQRRRSYSTEGLSDLPLAQINDVDQNPAAQAAVTQLVQAWMDRLQVLSVVTTFFASMDGTLLGLTAVVLGKTVPDKIASACLAGALIFHVAAAVISFTSSFVLLRYRIIDANANLPLPVENAPSGSFSPRVSTDKRAMAQPTPQHSSPPNHVYIEKIQPFFTRPSAATASPPLDLLTRCNTLCMWLTVLGFVMALTGVLAYSWTTLAQSVSIFTSACLGVCVIAGVIALR